jgi:hypothetical protein
MAKVMLVSKYKGLPCYKFLEASLNEAYKNLTGQDSISSPKIDALRALGVKITVTGETNKANNAA